MASYFTSSTLIDSVKRRASIPTNQSTYTDDDILAFANEEIALSIVPSILSLHEDYLMFDEDVALEDNTSSYRIPERAVGNKLRNVAFVDNNDNLYEMTRIGVDDIVEFQDTYNANRANAFYIQNNRVSLTPALGTGVSGFLRFYYYIRPSQLVSSTRIGIITNINRSTGEISVENVPDHFSASLTYDFYMHRSPHRPLKIDLTATTINSTTDVITFSTGDIPDELEVGDHVAQSEECMIPQIPSDLHVFLAQKVAERVLEAQGDTEGLRNAQAKSQQMQVMAGDIIDNRVEDAPIKLVNRNGLLRQGLRNRKYRNSN